VTTQRELRTLPALSAGGVVYRHGPEGVEVVLCGRSWERLWALPKGTPDPGESIEQTAEREVREETGLGVRIVADLGFIEYEFSRPAEGVRYEKRVHHFLMQPDGTGDTRAHDHEYDRVEWFPAGVAMRLLTHANERDVLQRALDVIERGDAV